MAKLYGSTKNGKIITPKVLKSLDLLEVSKLDLIVLTMKNHMEYKIYRKKDGDQFTFEVNRKHKKDLTKEGWELVKEADTKEIKEEYLLKVSGNE